MLYTKAEQLTFVGSSWVCVRLSAYNFAYHMFYLPLAERSEITLNTDENKEYRWMTPVQALEMPLIADEDVCIKLFYGLP